LGVKEYHHLDSEGFLRGYIASYAAGECSQLPQIPRIITQPPPPAAAKSAEQQVQRPFEFQSKSECIADASSLFVKGYYDAHTAFFPSFSFLILNRLQG
jgi:hypothetical protein